MQDTEDMTLGMWVDYIVEWNNMQTDDGADQRQGGGSVRTKPKKRQATQRDFDMF